MKRRDFLKISAPLSLSPLVLNGVPLQSFASPLTEMTTCLGVEDRVLVVIQLFGGNDGLNTIIPVDQYGVYKGTLRPNIGISDTGPDAFINLDTTLPIADQVGLHPSMTALKNMYDSGQMNLIQGVGYPNPNRSHFKSRDLVLTGGDGTAANFQIPTGWMGRYLEYSYPGAAGNPSPLMQDPLGIQLGDAQQSLGFHTGAPFPPAINLSGQDVSGFYTLISEVGGPLPVPPLGTDYGEEMLYVMNIERNTSVYAERISDTFDNGSNAISYPNYNLAQQLQTVARLISGGSKTKVFLVNLSGFDTHAGQIQAGSPAIGNHANLLEELSESVKAFFDDLQGLGLGDRVMAVTFSEFGRKAAENGSNGSDHGTLMPMMVFGNHVNPGVTGTNVDLSNLAPNWQLQGMQYDYRQIYTSLLQDWLGAANDTINATLFSPFLSQKIPIVTPAQVVDPSCYISTFLPSFPVGLLSFHARTINEESVMLEWETATERDSDHFQIERSQDKQLFESIGTIAAAGNSNRPIRYEDYDEEPLSGLSYYRLKMVDKDGSFSYSNIVEIDLPIEAAFDTVKVYPNPADTELSVKFRSAQSGTVELKLLTVQGNLSLQKKMEVREGDNELMLPLSSLASGMYILELKSAGYSMRYYRKIVVQH